MSLNIILNYDDSNESFIGFSWFFFGFFLIIFFFIIVFFNFKLQLFYVVQF
jgi:hypothetical protein